MIEVKNISKSFDDKQVLKNISAKFYDGKTNLIIGLSGSGKNRIDEKHRRACLARRGRDFI